MLAWLHHAAGRDPSFLVGGRPGNFPHGGRLGGGEDLVLEGDEYDTAFFDKGPKFLHYWPQVAVIGAVEFDHADIYADLAAVERAFALFVRMVPESGLLAVPHDDPVARRLAAAARCRVATFGLDEGAGLAALERAEGEDGQRFVAARDGRALAEVRLALPGPHNAKNALAALLAAEAAGLPIEDATRHLATWGPPRRRREVAGRGGGVVAYDDFAHHPTAIAHTLATLRARVPAGASLPASSRARTRWSGRSSSARWATRCPRRTRSSSERSTARNASRTRTGWMSPRSWRSSGRGAARPRGRCTPTRSSPA
jgi:UDP-N-acetylmuramate: L-alanyl-gamma-D-glutamyl-meso-diaminopimelate ligase